MSETIGKFVRAVVDAVRSAVDWVRGLVTSTEEEALAPPESGSTEVEVDKPE